MMRSFWLCCGLGIHCFRNVCLTMTFMAICLVPVDALLCSQCMSNATGSCALRAPDATPCQPRDHSDAGPANCMVARQIDRNGTVQSYIRGCSQVRVGTGCLPHPNGTSLCYRTCSEDGCNLAMAHDNFPSLYCAVLVFIYICLL